MNGERVLLVGEKAPDLEQLPKFLRGKGCDPRTPRKVEEGLDLPG